MGTVHCPHCDKDIEAPEIATIDPDAKLPKNPFRNERVGMPSAWRAAIEVYKETLVEENWRKVIG